MGKSFPIVDVWFVVALGLVALGAVSMRPATALAQGTDSSVEWGFPTRVSSPEGTNSWFSDLAVDSKGRVHITWCQSGNFGLSATQIESVYYSMWDGQQWSLYNDVVPAQQDIVRNSIAIDGYDMVHLLYDSAPPFSLYHKKAPADQAYIASGWTESKQVNERDLTYMNDIAINQNTIHILYDDLGMIQDGQCDMCADVFYRHSTDLGDTWSTPIALFPTVSGSSRAQMEVDSSNNIYVSWDEGWDRLTGRGEPVSGVFMVSRDGGSTWSEPLAVTYPASNNAQLTVGSDGKGGVMLVWRTTSAATSGIYYMWSEDWGATFTQPRTLTGLVARRYSSPFDRYDMATDSAGHIHLIAVGHLAENQNVGGDTQGPPGLFHIEWDGNRWLAPQQVYEGSWYPEYPNLVIAQGNQLHLTWFTRLDPNTDVNTIPQQVWYASGKANAPQESPLLLPTPTATLEKPLIEGGGTFVEATPTVDPKVLEAAGPIVTSEKLKTENDELLLLAASLVPALVLAAIGAVFVRSRRG